MYYNSMEIRPKSFGESGFNVSWSKTPYDRESGKGSLNAGLGFYHYPRKLGEEKAFCELRDSMIAVRQKCIDRMLSDIEELRKLELPK